MTRFEKEHLAHEAALAVASGHSVEESLLASNAHSLLKSKTFKDSVSRHLVELQDKSADRAELKREVLVEALLGIALSSVSDVATWDAEGVTVKDSKLLDNSQKRAVSEISFDSKGGVRVKGAAVADKIKAIDSIARLLGLEATQQVSLTVAQSPAALIQELEQRRGALNEAAGGGNDVASLKLPHLEIASQSSDKNSVEIPVSSNGLPHSDTGAVTLQSIPVQNSNSLQSLPHSDTASLTPGTISDGNKNGFSEEGTNSNECPAPEKLHVDSNGNNELNGDSAEKFQKNNTAITCSENSNNDTYEQAHNFELEPISAEELEQYRVSFRDYLLKQRELYGDETLQSRVIMLEDVSHE